MGVTTIWIHHWGGGAIHIVIPATTFLLFKAKMQYLLSFQITTYCLLALHIIMVQHDVFAEIPMPGDFWPAVSTRYQLPGPGRIEGLPGTWLFRCPLAQTSRQPTSAWIHADSLISGLSGPGIHIWIAPYGLAVLASCPALPAQLAGWSPLMAGVAWLYAIWQLCTPILQFSRPSLLVYLTGHVCRDGYTNEQITEHISGIVQCIRMQP